MKEKQEEKKETSKIRVMQYFKGKKRKNERNKAKNENEKK